MSESLDRIFNARSIAVVGASTDPKKPGHEILKNIVDIGYKGKVFPINPKADQILGFKCYKSLSEVPEPIELVVFVVPAPVTLKIVEEELIPRKKKFNDTVGVVMVGGGFKETGTKEGEERERRLKELLNSVGIRLIGPNCQGIIDTTSKVNTTFDVGDYKKGGVSVITQSGALSCSFLMWAKAHDLIGLDKFISFGNMADIDVVEVMEYLADVSTTKVIWVYLEGYNDGKRFLEVAKKVSAKKPIIVLKPGRTQAGAAAASSHTGAMAGEDQIWDAVFKQTGIIRAYTLQELYHTTRAFEKLPLIRGNRIAVLTVCGGLGTLCVEEIASSRHLRMASFSEEAKQRLREILAPTATVGRPDGYVDMTGSVTEKLHYEALRIVLNEDGVDGVIFLTTPPAFLPQREWAIELAKAYNSQPEDRKKPVIAVLGFGDSAMESKKALEENGIPAYDFPEIAVRVMDNMVKYYLYREKAQGA